MKVSARKMSPPDRLYACSGAPYLKIADIICMIVYEQYNWDHRQSQWQNLPRLGDKTCPTRKRSQYFDFYLKLVLFGHNNTIFWTFMTIHNTGSFRIKVHICFFSQDYFLTHRDDSNTKTFSDECYFVWPDLLFGLIFHAAIKRLMHPLSVRNAAFQCCCLPILTYVPYFGCYRALNENWCKQPGLPYLPIANSAGLFIMNSRVKSQRG